jgi:hypothetical protein
MLRSMASTSESLSRGLETINVAGGRRIEAAAAKARENSRTRVERSWTAVGDSLRQEMRNRETPGR